METKPEAPIAKSEMSSTEAAEFLHVTRRSVARFATEGKLGLRVKKCVRNRGFSRIDL